jgi:hypothetical protein
MLGGDEAGQRTPREELARLPAAAGGEETGLGGQQEDGPQDEGRDVDRLQRGIDQEIRTVRLTSALP